MKPGRPVQYQVAASLDGFLAGPDGAADWILMDPEIDFGALLDRFDVVVLGRRTYAAMGAMGGSSGPAFGKTTYVASRHLPPIDRPGIEVVRDAVATVRALRAQPGRGIWLFGGGELASCLLDAGLVDGVEIAVIPILLGAGIPLLSPTLRRHPLALRQHRVYPTTGTVMLSYSVEG